jgi:hypothetical protein
MCGVNVVETRIASSIGHGFINKKHGRMMGFVGHSSVQDFVVSNSAAHGITTVGAIDWTFLQPSR